MTRLIAMSLSAGLVLWAALVVPMPFFELRPGSVHTVEDMLQLSAATGEVRGDLDLLTIRQTTPNILEAMWVGVHPDRELSPAGERAPAGIDQEVYREIQADAFQTSFLTAVAIAARQAGYEVELATSAVVAQVLADGPSDGLLRAGDVITAIDGVAVDSGTDLVAELQASDEPRDVVLEVRGGNGDPRAVTVGMRQLSTTDRPVLGIVVETIAQPPALPFDASLDDTDILGPSAGMMLALTATDLLLEEDLTDGRTIAGTGTIDLDGRVGPVGGVEQKARAAVAAGVDLLLVPVGQLPEARAAVEAGIDVVGVATFQDALDAVRGTADDVAAPAP